MKFKFMAIGAALLMSAGSIAASAQTLSYSDAGAMLAKSCGPDIQKFCSTVNLGNDQLRQCLLQHESQINPQCVTDYKVAVASIAKRVAAQNSIEKVCANDAANRCQGMVPGDGHLLSCLVTAARVVSKKCNQVITDAGYR
ncbi:cysteine rich repeat-containing protein [Kaistia dalseonensis]|uniref:Cysteine rich repeat protein n=1 Tax=Kaistia dalseonensis TaxID=410840 RepID=A0ABU0HA99_9HYPH|nr:cysteine rich repeat-containing protein [Kaistia dalseonensis]MCX5496611.1 cysteine rich repeat-containing protein [Kaistia dalseonensis]MDQ0439234.1 hypothetical protein [Kaistia dalseonensis]